MYSNSTDAKYTDWDCMDNKQKQKNEIKSCCQRILVIIEKGKLKKENQMK